MLIALKLVMPYLSKRDLQSLSRCCSQLNFDARQEMRHRTMKLAQLAFKCIDQHENSLILAGSLALWLNQNGPTHWFPNDADLFWYGNPSTKNEVVLKTMIENEMHNISFLFQYEKPLIHNVKTKVGQLQFILSSYFKNPMEILKSFDLTCCRIAYKNKNTIAIDPLFNSSSFYWLSPNIESLTNHDKKDLLALKQFHYFRMLQRIAKYEQRKLVNLGMKKGSIDILKFSIVYKRESSIIYQNNLIHRSVSDERYLTFCTCDTTWCDFCLESTHCKHINIF